MTKNGIIGLSAGAIIVLGGLTLYTNSAFSSQISQAIENNEHPQFKLSVESQESGLFGGSAQYKLVLNRDALAQAGAPNQSDVEFYFNHEYASYPLLVDSQFTIDFTKGAPKELMELFTVDSIDHIATLSTNLLSQSNSLNVAFQPATLEDKSGSVVKTGKMTSNIDGNLEFSEGTYNFDFSELTGELTSGGNMLMTAFTGNGDFASEQGFVYTKQSTTSLKELSFKNEAVLEQWALKNLSFLTSTTPFDGDVVSSDSKVSFDSVIVKNAMADYTITDTVLDIAIKDIDKNGVIAVNEASRSGAEIHELIAATKDILARGFKGDIKSLTTTVNGVKVDSKGAFDVPAYAGEMNQQMIMMHMMQKFSLDYNANLSNNYASVFPQYAPMIDGMAAQGFATKDAEGNVSTVIKIKDMAITANDKRIR